MSLTREWVLSCDSDTCRTEQHFIGSRRQRRLTLRWAHENGWRVTRQGMTCVACLTPQPKRCFVCNELRSEHQGMTHVFVDPATGRPGPPEGHPQ